MTLQLFPFKKTNEDDFGCFRGVRLWLWRSYKKSWCMLSGQHWHLQLFSCWACCVPALCCAEGVEILLMSSSSPAEPMHSRKLKPELFSLVLIWKVNWAGPLLLASWVHLVKAHIHRCWTEQLDSSFVYLLTYPPMTFFFPLCFSWLSMSVSVLSMAVNVLISEPFVSRVVW